MAIIVVGALNYLDLARLSKLLFFLKKKDMHLLSNIISLLNKTFLLLFGFEQFSFQENIFYRLK